MPNTIELSVGAANAPIVREALTAAGSSVVPGDLVELAAGELQEHSTAASNAQKAFALSNVANAGTVDDVYGAGETASYGIFASGQSVWARVAASATAIPDGAALESAGDGTLRVQTVAAATTQAQRDAVVAYAEEAVDNSGGGTTVRIRVTVA